MNDTMKIISDAVISKRMGIFLYEYDRFNFILFMTPEFPYLADILKTRNWEYNAMNDDDAPKEFDKRGYIFSRKYKEDFDEIFKAINDNVAKTKRRHVIKNLRGFLECSTTGINISNAKNITDVFGKISSMMNVDVVSITVDGLDVPVTTKEFNEKTSEIVVETVFSIAKILPVKREKVATGVIETDSRTRFIKNMISKSKGAFRILNDDGKGRIVRAQTPEKYASEKVLDRRENSCKTDLCGSSSTGVLDDGTKKCGLCGCNGHPRNKCACPSCGIVNVHICSECPILNAQYKALQRVGMHKLCSCSPAAVCAACKTFEDNFFLVEMFGEEVQISYPMSKEDVEKNPLVGTRILVFKNLFQFFFNRRKYGLEKIFTETLFSTDIRNRLKKIFGRNGNEETGGIIGNII